MKKDLGNINNIAVNITAPMKLEIDNLEYSELSLFTGTNGTGKSLINTLLFASTYIANGIILDKTLLSSEENLKLLSKFIFDNSLNNPVTGKFYISYSSGLELELVLDNNNLVRLHCDGYVDVDIPRQIIYMTTEMRLFNSIHMCLKHAKRLGLDISNIESNLSSAKELVNDYKLQNILAISKLVKMAVSKFEIDKELMDVFLNFDEKLPKFKHFCINDDKTEFYFLDENLKEYKLTSFSNGHQAIFNTFLTST